MNALPDETAPLREAMIDELRALGGICSEPVAAAFQAVPRHLFAPDVPIELAYATNASVWPKHDTNGALVSTVSAAHIQAVQLEQTSGPSAVPGDPARPAAAQLLLPVWRRARSWALTSVIRKRLRPPAVISAGISTPCCTQRETVRG